MARLWTNGPEFDPGHGVALGTDSLLLADFVTNPGTKMLELCCGSGAVTLLILSRFERLTADCVELLPLPCEDAYSNFAMNGLENRAFVINADIREHRRLFAAGSYSLVVCNPPYFPARSGSASPNTDRAVARSEAECTLADVLDASAWALKNGGDLDIVYRPERLPELMSEMRRRSLEPKRLRMVHHSANSAPSLVLVSARRAAAPGLRVYPPLLLRDESGAESAEYRRICHREDE